jgi:pilus assembly protein CpaB
VISQRGLLALAIAAGALAGVLYFVGARRAALVVAARDLDATHALVADDLATAEFPADAVPAGAIADVAAALGRVPRAPLWRGQLLIASALADSAATFHTGLGLPPGLRAVALPVSAAQALGGALRPGARVDVLAVPAPGRAPSGRTTELLAHGALVLDVRGESGAPYGAVGGKAQPAAPERIGSVVVAILPADELRFADRIATSTFVLVSVTTT